MRAFSAIKIVAIALPILMLSACANTYGRLAIDHQVERDVRAGVVKPEFQYYYSGREDLPYAIIGIDRTYSVPSRYWIKFDPDADRLRKLSASIFDEVQTDPYGAMIKAPDGQTIGIWYSNLYNYTVRVDQNAHTVDILFPNPENDNRLGGANAND